MADDQQAEPVEPAEELSPPEEKKPNFHAAVLDSDGVFRVESFASVSELVQRLKQLIDTDVSVACFSGERLAISKPPFRYLLTPEENIALYDVPEEPEPDDTGYLGVDPAHLESPPEIPTARQQAENEFFSDDTDDVASIFDEPLPDPDA